ncbi:MAG: tRNA (adenosine(37)-N6)-dimethylallyltransferase MiaA [Candidatus Alcyoniella australis]|nr:tRNA (adenosine(37)-N6)-dimethylallyltransferase MiaA [Candidatus Alcyoniella australis]
MSARVLAIVGPTASGKTELAVGLALELGAQIVNADSMQVYRNMDRGTAKPTAQQRAQVRFHLVDVVDPQQGFSANQFAQLAREAIEQIGSQGMLPLVCGGTGLYIKALFSGLFQGPEADPDLRAELMAQEAAQRGSLHQRLAQVDPQSAERISVADSVRLVRALEVYQKTGRSISELQAEHGFGGSDFQVTMIGLDPPRDELYRRIEQRVDAMFAAGLVHEVAALLAAGLQPALPAFKAIGYRQVVAHLAGEYDLDEARRLVKRDTRRLAKRQLTWFRGQADVRWLDDPQNLDAAMAIWSGQGGAPC